MSAPGGGTCVASNEECCLCANQSGIVLANAKSYLKGLRARGAGGSYGDHTHCFRTDPSAVMEVKRKEGVE